MAIPGIAALRTMGMRPVVGVIPRDAYTKLEKEYTPRIVDAVLRKYDQRPNTTILEELCKVKTYGSFTSSDVLYMYQIPPHTFNQLVTILPVYRIVKEQAIGRAAKALEQFAAVTEVVDRYIKHRSLKESVDTLKKYINMVAGLPVVDFTHDGVHLRGGIGGLALPQERLIVSVGVMPIEEWSLRYIRAEQWDYNMFRRFAYYLAHTEVPPRVKPGDRNPHALAITELPSLLYNLPELIHRWVGMFDKLPPIDLSIGGRQALLRHLAAKHPEVVLPTNMPFCVEDYVPKAVWPTVPEAITRTRGPIKIVDNPYTFIPDFQVFNMAAHIRHLRVEFEQAMAALKTEDLKDPTWASKVLLTRDAEIKKFNYGEAYYYMAARGIKFPTFDLKYARELGHVYYIVVAIADAEGLGDTKEHARPTVVGFLREEIASLQPHHLALIAETFEIPDPELLTNAIFQDIVHRGYINPLPLGQHGLERHAVWKTLTPIHKKMLNAYYKREIDVRFFIDSNTQVLEHLICSYAPHHLETLIRDLGMVVPPGVAKDEYVTSALPVCDGVLAIRVGAARPDLAMGNLTYKTDIQILDFIQASIHYQTRTELVTRATRFAAGEATFFFPYERKCKNKETLDYSGTKTTDPTLFLIAYGTRRDYVCYQLSELVGGFAGYGPGGDVYLAQVPTFDAPGKYTAIPLDHVHTLRDLITPYVPHLKDPEDIKYGKELLSRIRRLTTIFEWGTKYDAERYGAFGKLPDEAYPLVKEYLLRIFELGMYARRWKGPPHPYPVTEKETLVEGTTFHPEVATADVLARIYELEAKLPRPAAEFVHNLHTVQHWRKQVLQTQTSLAVEFFRQYQEPRHEDRYCIRLGSATLIGTGHYYLQLFFKHTIPDYDPRTLEQAA